MSVSTGRTLQSSYRIPVDLHDKIKDIAVQNGETFTDVLMVAARLGLMQLYEAYQGKYWPARLEVHKALQEGKIS